MLSKDSGQSSQSTWSLYVSYDTDDYHGWSFEDGDGIDYLTLVHECSWAVYTTDYVGHTCLVSTECGEVWSCGCVVVMGEGTNASKVALGTLLWEESKGSATWGFELTVRPGVG